jgi:hypothetical protein
VKIIKTFFSFNEAHTAKLLILRFAAIIPTATHTALLNAQRSSGLSMTITNVFSLPALLDPTSFKSIDIIARFKEDEWLAAWTK